MMMMMSSDQPRASDTWALVAADEKRNRSLARSFDGGKIVETADLNTRAPVAVRPLDRLPDRSEHRHSAVRPSVHNLVLENPLKIRKPLGFVQTHTSFFILFFCISFPLSCSRSSSSASGNR